MIYRIGRVTSLSRPASVPMEVLLDGAPIDPSDLQFVAPSDLAGVELLTSGANTAIYGNDGTFGVILLTTKRGTGLSGLSNAINVTHFSPQGYANVRQFYSPAYDTPVQSKMADLRSTIYWNPDITTNAQGTASVSYFNADGAGTYKVTLEGLDLKGKLARQTYIYVVK